MIATSQLRPNPYVGPRAFRYGEPLYGRDREVIELLGLLIAERIVLLYSPSGAGKTSLVQAALIPALEKEDFQVQPVMRVSLEPSPGLERLPTTNRYVLSVLLSLEEALPPEQQMSLAQLARMTLADYLDQRGAGSDAPRPSVLIFDQFEEILTVNPTDQAAKEAFFAQVGIALRARHRWALFAMREEYSAGLDPYLRPIPTRLRTTFRLELLGEHAARLAMQRPARQAGVEFTDAAAQKLVNDLRRVRLQGPEGTTEELGLYVEPVHLQVVCRRLWERLPTDDREIGEEDVEVIGDVDSALASYYVERVAAIAGETGVSERSIREWFDRQLITAQGIRGQVLQDHERSQGLENRAIELLVDAHLVRAEKRRGATWFEMAHDRLIEPMRKNNAVWYQANLSALQRQVDLWERQGRPGSLLLRDQALTEAEQWASAHQAELTDTEHAFLAACREVQAIAERERWQTRSRWIATFVSVIAALAAFYFLGSKRVAEDKAQKAREAQIVSLARALAADKQDDQSALLALQAYNLVSNQQSVHALDQVNNALRRVLSAPYFSHILYGHKGAVRAVAFHPDGKLLASGSWDKTVRLWTLDNLSAAHTVVLDHDGPVLSVAFSPDRKLLASGSQDGKVRLWVLDNPSGPPIPLPDHRGLALSVAFSPDGQFLASGSSDRYVRLWKVRGSNAELHHDPLKHDGGVSSVAFSWDRKLLASGSWDGKVRLWALDPSAPPTPLQDPQSSLGPQGPVRAVVFHPDGKLLVSGSEDGKMCLWALDNLSAAPTVVRSPDGPVLSVALSPDGKFLVSGSFDDNVRLWEVGAPTAAPTPLQDPQSSLGPQGPIRAVAFHPDGKLLASGSQDGKVRLWALDNPSAPPIIFLDPPSSPDDQSPVRTVAFHPDGKLLASGSQDGKVRLWALDNPSAPPIIFLDPPSSPDDQSPVRTVAFHPDGKLLASGSQDGKVRLWALDNPSAPPIIFLDPPSSPDDQSPVRTVAFHPDGKLLALGSQDGKVRLWALDNPSAPPIIFLDPPSSPDDQSPIRAVAFHPDGKFLASGSDDTTIRLWNVGTGKLVVPPLRGHDGPVESVAFSRDGEFLASGSDDTTIRLWAPKDSGTLLGVLRGHQGRVSSVAFSPDEKGEILASGSEDKNILLWISRPERLAAMVCEKVRRNLSLEEWRQFMGESMPYVRTCSELPIHYSFVQAGQDLARAGDIAGAIAIFRQAQKLDPSLQLDPKAEAKKFAAEGQIEQERLHARQGKRKEAIAK